MSKEYRLTEWLKKEQLKSYEEPFVKYGEEDAYKIKSGKKGYALFTSGEYIDKDYK